MYRFEWTPDCSGKQDYDGQFVFVSTRYWPPYQYSAKHSAKASVLMHNADRRSEPKVLAEQEFSGDSEAEVKRNVELWVDLQLSELESVLLRAQAALTAGIGGSR